MAIFTDHKDGTLTVNLDPVEQDTVSGLQQGQLEAYVTLWLRERATDVFRERFGKLSPQQQMQIFQLIREAGK